MTVESVGLDGFELLLVALSVLVLLALWVLLARSRFIQGGVVERPERVSQLYGYAVCLATLLWALTSAVTIVESAFTLADPVHHVQNQFGMEPSITSFESFRMTYDRSRRLNAPDPAATRQDTVAESELRRRYETYRADRVAATVALARESLVVHLISLLLAGALFAIHWRWLQRRINVVAA